MIQLREDASDTTWKVGNIYLEAYCISQLHYILIEKQTEK